MYSVWLGLCLNFTTIQSDTTRLKCSVTCATLQASFSPLLILYAISSVIHTCGSTAEAGSTPVLVL